MTEERFAGAARDAWDALERAAFGTKWFRFAVREGPDTRTTVSETSASTARS